jgi:hypothetical protein
MKVIEGGFNKKEENATLRQMLQVVIDTLPETATGEFVVVIDTDGHGEMFTSVPTAEANLLLDVAKMGLLTFGMGEE